MRQYEPVWNELKKKKIARVTAHRALHPRIVKAVIKEKWMDVGYKLELEPHHSILSHSIKHSVITFTLTVHHDYSQIGAHEL
jgi:hypothetical protein